MLMVLLAVNFDNLHQILQSLYTDMMPLCSQMTGVAKGLAGLGALFYVAYRVWQSLARAEPIDVFPLLRPFALGICIMFFPTIVLGTLNSILSPVVTGTHRILETQTFDMNEYRQQKDKLEIEAMRRNPETAYLVDKEAFDNKLDELGALDAIEACGMYVDRAMYNMKKSVQNFFRELLELMFNAAALVIDTLRTFFLIVLSILGPISFAIACWDGFHASLTQWFVRYISIYLCGTVFVMISLGMNQFINSQGFGKIGMLTVMLGAFTNIVLDPILIFGLDMGVQGAALATVISQGLSAAWVMKFLTGKKAILRLSKRAMHLEWKLVKEIIFL